ncbi:MAG: hypothetical protein CVV05_12960 [Gammaproteobacteria bacterium HGW-Gammaproteobacteria-1]|nr:MAG: hypothetical protein CVV05_12960 [Gammaproteobacteria bacterium HGW-Gammaproteobacteria-1]
MISRDWFHDIQLPRLLVIDEEHQRHEFRVLDERIEDIPAARIGYQGIVLKVCDKNSDFPYAAKICPRSQYDASRTPTDEARLGAILGKADGLFCLPRFYGLVTLTSGAAGSESQYVCIITDWVEGKTLLTYLEEYPDEITPEWVCQVAVDLYRAVYFLAKNKLSHEDLHTKNVMLQDDNPDLLPKDGSGEKIRLIVVDTGSVTMASSASVIDFVAYIKILVEMYNAAIRNRRALKSAPGFVTKFREFIEKLVDDDESRCFGGDRYKELHRMCERLTSVRRSRVFQPFDAISAEHLASDTLLLQLFNEKFPWYSTVMSKAPTALAGPRGCGKSMFFRYLAAKTHLSPGGDSRKLESIPFLGVYIGCSSDLQNNLLWLTREAGMAERKANEIVTFFSLILLRELFKTLAAIQDSDFAAQLYGVTQSSIDDLISYCHNFLPESIETPRLDGISRARHYANRVDKLRVTLGIAMLHDDRPPIILPETFIGEVTNQLQQLCEPLMSRPIAFLLDDYTRQRIGVGVQRILNKVVWERKPSHLFKISSEKFGFDPDTIDGVKNDSEREFMFVDAGSYAIDRINHSNNVQFIRSLVDLRLEAANWKGRVDTLIGVSEFKSDIDMARFIRTQTKGAKNYYNGIDVIARLWSGDVSSILHIVREIFVEGDVGADYNEPIAKKTQHNAITRVSRSFVERVQTYHPYGDSLAHILQSYGGFVRDVLRAGAYERKTDNPRRLIQIEFSLRHEDDVFALLKEAGLRLYKREDADLIARELLRRSVFVERSDSSAKESPAFRTIRWQLRRVYLPNFGAALERHSYLDIKNIEEFVSLLYEPSKFLEHKRIGHGVRKHGTSDMFDGEE